MKKITAILVDDERNARLALRAMLEENCPEVEILEEAEDVPEAIKSIRKVNPDLVFLDVEMPGYSGLEILDFISPEDFKFKIIFVTAYAEYAVQAFELSAFDYLLKPVQVSQLKKTITKFIENAHETPSALQYQILKDNFNVAGLKRIALQTAEGLLFLKLEEIIYLKADSSYTHFILENGSRLTLTKKLLEFEKLQDVGNFFRTHRSYIVNLDRIRKFVRHDGGTLIMDNGDEVSIAADKKQILLDRINNIKI